MSARSLAPLEHHPWDLQSWQVDRQVCRHKVAGRLPCCLPRSCLRGPCGGFYSPLSFSESTFIVGLFMCKFLYPISFVQISIHVQLSIYFWFLALFFFPYHCDFFIACFSYDCLSLQLPLLLIDKSPVFLSSSAVFPSVFSLFPPLSCYLLPLSSFPNQPPPPHFLQYPLSHPAFHSQCSAVSLPN